MFIVGYWVPVTVVGSGYPTMRQARLCPHGAYVGVAGRRNKHTDTVVKVL